MVGHSERFESRLFQHHWDDGLLDLFAGVGVVGIGIFWAVDLVALGVIVPVLITPFWGPLQRRLVEPRVGLVEFGDTRTSRNRRLLIGSGVLGLVMLVLFIALYLGAASTSTDLLRFASPGIPAGLIGLLAALVGLGLGLPRFVAYAALFCVCGFGVAAADAKPEEAMIAGGILVSLGGARLLYRFLHLETVTETGEED